MKREKVLAEVRRELAEQHDTDHRAMIASLMQAMGPVIRDWVAEMLQPIYTRLAAVEGTKQTIAERHLELSKALGGEAMQTLEARVLELECVVGVGKQLHRWSRADDLPPEGQT